jgi:hypothetical protein
LMASMPFWRARLMLWCAPSASTDTSLIIFSAAHSSDTMQEVM